MRRPLLALLIVTLAGVAGAAWSVWDAERTSIALVAAPGPMFPELVEPGVAIDSVEVTTADYKLHLEHRDDGWRADSKGGYPVRKGMADDLIRQIASLERREAKTRNPAWYGRIDVGDVGADSSSRLVRLAGKNLKPVSVLVGKRSDSVGADPIGATFVRRSGDAQAWLAEGVVDVPDRLGQWFVPLVHVPGPEVKEISIFEGATEVFDAQKEKGATSYTLEKIDPRYAEPGKVGNDARIKAIETGIVSVDLVDVRRVDAVTFPPDARTVRFKTGDGLVIAAKLGQADGETWVAYSASAPEGSDATDFADGVNSRCKGWAFRIADNKVEALQTPIASLLTTKQAAKPQAGPAPGTFLTPQQMQAIPGFGPAK